MFVTCGIGGCDLFTGCAELRLDTCRYPYNGRYGFVELTHVKALLWSKGRH